MRIRREIAAHPQGRVRVVIAAVQLAAAQEGEFPRRKEFWLEQLRSA